MTKPFKDKKIGVLMGGISGEREVSLRSGKGVLDSLLKQGYDAVGIDAVQDVDVKLRENSVEIAYIALHGRGGEDGMIQGLLETMRIPYTGSGITASALSMSKKLTKLVLAMQGLPTPKAVYPDAANGAKACAEEILNKIGIPVIIKPECEGSSLGCVIAHNEKELFDELPGFLEKFGGGVAEAMIQGREITVGVIGPGANVRALPILEMVPKNEFYDYEAKYTKGMTDLICPARLDEKTTKLAQAIAVKTHLALGCDGVSRVDFMVDGAGNPFVLELNSIPGMTVTSDLPEEIKAEGGSYDSLVLEILASAALDKG